MTSYKCIRCGYSTNHKGTFIRHIERVRQCKAIEQNASKNVHLFCSFYRTSGGTKLVGSGSVVRAFGRTAEPMMHQFFQMLRESHQLGRASIWKNCRTDASDLSNAREETISSAVGALHVLVAKIGAVSLTPLANFPTYTKDSQFK